MSYNGRTVNQVFNQDFIIDSRFKITKELGHGAYGIVCSAQYDEGSGSTNGNVVAIKKITNIFSKKILCKRALREIKLLQFFRGHKNITCLYDLDIVVDPATGTFNDIYLYEELMECDMHQIIRSGQPLTDLHYQLFIYQILCGLKYIHSADVLHRDLKPGNLLVNVECDLKICDFGLARGFSEDVEQNLGFMTEYVATRWYRAPEIMLSFSNYTKAIDIWSVGCILGELLGGKPLFRGKDYVDQLNQILMVLGTPKESALTKIGSPRAQNYVRSLPIMRKIHYKEILPNANPLALDLLEKMLAFDPFERITVDEALNHPYLSVWHDPLDEPESKVKFDFKTFETVDDIESMRNLIIEEVKSFREFVRKPIHEQKRILLETQREQEQQQQRQEELNQVELHRQRELERHEQYLQQEQQQQHQHQAQLQKHHQDHHDEYNQFSQQLQQQQQQQNHHQTQQHQSQQFGMISKATPDREFDDHFTGMYSAITPGLNSAGLLTDPTQIHNDENMLLYDSMPKPQELEEFSIMVNKGNPELFELEEELGFGMDGGGYHNQP